MSEPSASEPTEQRAGGAPIMLPLSHYAMLVGLCELLPLPFVDDWMQQRLLRKAMGQVLRGRGRRFRVEDVQPLYAGGHGILGRTGSLAKGLLLKPAKKLFRKVFIVFAARRAVLEAAEVLLLGHTLDRLLAAGWLPEDASAKRRTEQAQAIAVAVERAWAGSDRRALTELIRRSGRLLLSREGRVESPPATAIAGADEPRKGEPELEVENLEASLPPGQRQRLQKAAHELYVRLSSGEGRSWLAQFDAQVDARLTPVRPS